MGRWVTSLTWGSPSALLNFSGDPAEQKKNTVLKAATKTKTKTGDECYNMCLKDSR